MNGKNINSVTKKILKECKKEYFYKAITSLLNRAFLMVIPIVYSQIIDFASKSNFEKAYYFIIMLAIITVAYYLSEMLNQFAFYKLYRKIYKKYTMEAYNCTVNNSIYSLSRFSLGEYTNIINSDIEVIANYYSTIVIWIFRMLEFPFIYFYFLTLNINVFYATILASALMALSLKYSGKKTKINSDNKKKMLDSKSATVIETFNGIKEIKGFHIFEKIKLKFEAECNNYLKADSKYNTQANNSKFIVLNNLELVRLGLIFYGIYLFSEGQIELGIVLLIYNYYQKIIDNFSILSTISIERKNVKVSLGRYNKLLEYRRIEDDIIYYSKQEYEGKITFEEVLYGNKSDPILNDVSFEINPNSFTVITGRVGSGKTGIFDLLLKLNSKHNGSILIDGNDIDRIDTETYYNLISSVRKRPIFFDASIKENLMLVDENLERIEEICRLLNIHDDIIHLSNGYETNINSSIDNISAELKQMLAIARVLVKDSKIMLFDETISGLNNENQKIVLDLINTLKKDHTIVVITREKDFLKHADEIIVVDENKIKDVGSYKNLLRKKGIFYGLFGIEFEL